MTENFFSYTLSQGNNLIDPNPIFDLPGLKPGDHWYLCISLWEQPMIDGMPPHVILEATEFATLNTIPLDTLENFCVTLG